MARTTSNSTQADITQAYPTLHKPIEAGQIRADPDRVARARASPAYYGLSKNWTERRRIGLSQVGPAPAKIRLVDRITSGWTGTGRMGPG